MESQNSYRYVVMKLTSASSFNCSSKSSSKVLAWDDPPTETETNNWNSNRTFYKKKQY